MMHSLETVSSVPAFLMKLWKLVEDPSNNHMICWSQQENSFIIKNQQAFSKELLPRYFKHNNMASFIRQLNLYGFRKATNIEKGSLRNEEDEIEFYHPFFVKHEKELLALIKRKTAANNTTGKSVSGEPVHNVLADVKTLRAKQESIDALLSTITQENEALWREIAILRQNHSKQQQVIARLLHFFASILNSKQRNIIQKRNYPLMIDEGKSVDKNFPPRKKLKKDITLSVTDEEPNSLVIRDVTDMLENGSPHYNNNKHSNTTLSQETVDTSLAGIPFVEANDSIMSPILDTSLKPSETLDQLSILERLGTDFIPFSLSDDALLEPNQPDKELLDIIPPNDVSSTVIVPDSISSKPSTSNYDTVSLTKPGTSTMNVLLPTKLMDNPSTSVSSPDVDALPKTSTSDHVEPVDKELNWLYEQFSGDELNLDVSKLLSLFSSDGSAAGNTFSTDFLPSYKSSNEIIGNEIIQCPSTFDWDLDEDSLQDIISPECILTTTKTSNTKSMEATNINNGVQSSEQTDPLNLD